MSPTWLEVMFEYSMINLNEAIILGWEQANFNRYLRCEMPDYII